MEKVKFSFCEGEGLLYKYGNTEDVFGFDIRTTQCRYIYDCADSGVLPADFRKEYIISAYDRMENKLEPDVKVGRKLQVPSLFETWPAIQDVFLNKKERQMLHERLQQTAKDITPDTCYLIHSSGLYTLHNGHHVFVLGAEVLCEDQNDKDRILLGDELRLLEWNRIDSGVTSCTYADYLKQYFDVVPGSSEILSAHQLFSVVKPFFVKAGFGKEINFGINYFGKTGAQKTSLVKAINCPLKDSSILTVSIDVDSKTNIVKRYKSFQGFTVLSDDFNGGESDNDKKNQMGRMNAVIRLIETDPNSAAGIVTSEFLAGKLSLQDRFLQIEAGECNLPMLTTVQFHPERMSAILLGFAQGLVSHVKDTVLFIKKYYTDLEQKSSDHMFRFERSQHALMLSVLLFEEILLEERHDFSDSLKEALDKQIQFQYKRRTDAEQLEELRGDGVLIFIHAIASSAIEEREYMFWKTLYKSQRDEELNHFYCYHKNHLYITKHGLTFALREVFYGEVKTDAVLKDLKENGLLKINQGSYQNSWIYSNHVVCVDFSQLLAYVGAVKPEWRDKLQLSEQVEGEYT